MIDYVMTGDLDENSYMITRDGCDDCILIDPGMDAKKVQEMCDRAHKTPKYVLLTHGHFDHIGSAKYFQDRGAKVYVHVDDAERLKYDRMAVMFGYSVQWLKADELLHDGDVLNILGYVIKVMHTPGHSRGSCVYIIDELSSIFSGDTIFFHSYGRTDFPGGEHRALIDSMRRLFALDGMDDYRIYAGHGISTTLGDEKKYNMINMEL